MEYTQCLPILTKNLKNEQVLDNPSVLIFSVNHFHLTRPETANLYPDHFFEQDMFYSSAVREDFIIPKFHSRSPQLNMTQRVFGAGQLSNHTKTRIQYNVSDSIVILMMQGLTGKSSFVSDFERRRFTLSEPRTRKWRGHGIARRHLVLNDNRSRTRITCRPT